MTLRSLVGGYQRFGGNKRLHLQFHSEDRSGTFLQIVSNNLQDCTTSQPRSQSTLDLRYDSTRDVMVLLTSIGFLQIQETLRVHYTRTKAGNASSFPRYDGHSSYQIYTMERTRRWSWHLFWQHFQRRFYSMITWSCFIEKVSMAVTCLSRTLGLSHSNPTWTH